MKVKLFCLLFLLGTIIKSQTYYYYNGTKIELIKKDKKHLIILNEIVSSHEFSNIFSKEDIKTIKVNAKSRYIEVESNTLSKENIKNKIKASPLSNKFLGITDIYSSQKGINEFTSTDRIMIKIKDEANLVRILEKYGLRVIDQKWLENKVYLLQTNEINDDKTIQIANKIYESGLIEFSTPDFLVHNLLETGTNDTYYPSQWNLDKISAASAWDITTGSSSIIIAVIDVGVESHHPDLQSKLVSGYNVPWDNNYIDPDKTEINNAHGTCVAGIAAAATNNSVGIAGVGYNCRIMPIKFTHQWNEWSHGADLAIAIGWAANNGAHVINISGGTGQHDGINNEISNAVNNGRNGKGCVIIKSVEIGTVAMKIVNMILPSLEKIPT